MSRVAVIRQAVTAQAAAKKSGPLQLRIGDPGDAFEREADRVADDVLADHRPALGWSLARLDVQPGLQRQCDCGEAGPCERCGVTLRRRAEGAAFGFAPPVVHEVLRSPGRPLQPGVRQFFEQRFGHDFGNVRIHAGGRAAESARAGSARAYTVGQNVVFADSAYAPETRAGKRLLAHELAHVVQQSGRLQGDWLQRDDTPDQGSPVPHKCKIPEDEIEDGDSEFLDPPFIDDKNFVEVDYVIFGKRAAGESDEAASKHTRRAFIDKAYGRLPPDIKAAVTRVMLSEFTFFAKKETTAGCAVLIFLESQVMDRLAQVSNIELRVPAEERRKAAAEREKQQQSAEKAAQAARERKQAGEDAEKRERQAGLPKLGDSGFTGGEKGNSNAPALPAKLVGPEMQPTKGTGTYRMDLDYAAVGNDTLSQVSEAMNFVYYHWERFDITDLVVKGLKKSDEKKLKRQKVSSENEVGSMAATERRAGDAYRDLEGDTENSIEDLLHPVQASSTGSAADIATKAIANYENLTLLPASIIVSAGGWALGALADLMGGTFQEREIPWPEKPGYYLVRCIAQPSSQGTSQRAASVATLTVELRDTKKLAENELLKPQAAIAEKQAEIKIAEKQTPPDEKELARLRGELEALQTKATGPAEAVIEQALNEKKAEYDKASDYRKSQLEDEIQMLQNQLEHAQKRGIPKGGSMRLQASLVSKVTGSTFPLLLELVKTTPKTQKFGYAVSDVSTRDGSLYAGEAGTEAQAAWNAITEFAHHNDYGAGMLAVALPEGAAFALPGKFIANEQHDIAITKRRINDLMQVLMILGLFVPGVGEVAMVLGAAVAAAHLIERWQNGTLRIDEALISDLMAVLGAVFAGASLIGKMAVVRTSENFLLRSVASIGKAAEIGNKALNYGGMVWGGLKDVNDIMADNQAELEGKISHAEARRNRATKIAAAVQSGALIIHSLHGEMGGAEKPGATERPDEPATAKDKATDSDAAKTNRKAKGETPIDPAAKPEGIGKSETAAEMPAKPQADPVETAKEGKSGAADQKINPQAHEPHAEAATTDGQHKLTVLEDGRIIRCSASCGELRQHYQEFLDTALQDTDPKIRERAQALEEKLQKAEEGARSGRKSDKQFAAKAAAELEPQLREMAAQALGQENPNINAAGIGRLSEAFTPSDVRGLGNALGPKRLKALSEHQRVRNDLALGLAEASGDAAVRGTMLKIMENNFGHESKSYVPDNQLAKAIGDLGKLQREVPGYIASDFLSEYEAALQKGDPAGAKKLLNDRAHEFHEAKKAQKKEALKTALKPLEADLAARQGELDSLKANTKRLELEKSKAHGELNDAKRAMGKKGLSDAEYQKAKDAVRAAQERLAGIEEKLDSTGTISESEKDVGRAQQAIDLTKLAMDPESRAPLPCFAGDTPVWTPQGMRRIDALMPGDVVNTFDVSARRVAARPVRQVFRNRTEHFYHLRAGGGIVAATGQHRFFVKSLGEWVPASALQPGMKLHLRDADEAELEAIELHDDLGDTPSWNLQIEGNPNYFVGPGLLAHNQGFDTKLGGELTIYRGTNKNIPEKVYVGKTGDLTKGGGLRGVAARQKEHRDTANEKLKNKEALKLTKEDIAFYEFMSEVVLEEVVTGIKTDNQTAYLEQKNIEIEASLMGGEHNVLNRRNEITSPQRMRAIEDEIKHDQNVIDAGFCKK